MLAVYSQNDNTKCCWQYQPEYEEANGERLGGDDEAAIMKFQIRDHLNGFVR